MDKAIIIIAAGVALHEAMWAAEQAGLSATVVVDQADAMDVLLGASQPEPERYTLKYRERKVERFVPRYALLSEKTHPTSPRSQRGRGRKNW